MTYRIPKTMIKYMIFGAVIIMVPISVSVVGTDLPNWLESGIVLLSLAVLATAIIRVARMATVVKPDGITRRGFLSARHYRWSDIRDFHVYDNGAVHVAYGFQVTSRYVVSVEAQQHQGRKKTLFFFDERAFPSGDRFQAAFNEFVALWQQRRDVGSAT